jgi:hypothetical protein
MRMNGGLLIQLFSVLGNFEVKELSISFYCYISNLKSFFSTFTFR